MNRSILIVLCDFLLVTLVAFSSFDPEKAPRVEARPAADSKATTANQDLVGALRLALEDEKQSRERLASSLQSTERGLEEREQKVRQLQENLRRTEAQAAQIDQERTALARQASTAQDNLAETQRKLATAGTENLLSKEMVQALQADLKQREQETQSLQQKLAATEQAMLAAQTEKRQLNAQLQVSETEKRLTREQVSELRGTLLAEREEKAKIQEYTTLLATNVATLALKSGELTAEIRDQRTLAANTIYSQFLTNRVTAQFAGARSGLLGRDVLRDKTTLGLIFSAGTQPYLLLHVDDTPLTLSNPGTDWNRLLVTLFRSPVTFKGTRLSFLVEDPRVVVIPVDQSQATQLGVKVYPAATDPFKYQDAVIVGANEEYYGECKFQIEPASPQYVKLDRSFIRGLFGKFNPSRGDLVLTKSGDLLGIMANSEYCVLLNRVTPSRTIQLGENISDQHTGQILSQLFDRVFQMPIRLQ